MHSSPSREDFVFADELILHPRRRQVMFGSIGVEGSSESDSGGAGDGTCGRAARGARGAGKFCGVWLTATGFGGGGSS